MQPVNVYCWYVNKPKCEYTQQILLKLFGMIEW